MITVSPSECSSAEEEELVDELEPESESAEDVTELESAPSAFALDRPSSRLFEAFEFERITLCRVYMCAKGSLSK